MSVCLRVCREASQSRISGWSLAGLAFDQPELVQVSTLTGCGWQAWTEDGKEKSEGSAPETPPQELLPRRRSCLRKWQHHGTFPPVHSTPQLFRLPRGQLTVLHLNLQHTKAAVPLPPPFLRRTRKHCTAYQPCPSATHKQPQGLSISSLSSSILDSTVKRITTAAELRSLRRHHVPARGPHFRLWP